MLLTHFVTYIQYQKFVKLYISFSQETISQVYSRPYLLVFRETRTIHMKTIEKIVTCLLHFNVSNLVYYSIKCKGHFIKYEGSAFIKQFYGQNNTLDFGVLEIFRIFEKFIFYTFYVYTVHIDMPRVRR